MVHEIVNLQMKEEVQSEGDVDSMSFKFFYVLFATLQALSITQQGLLNAIVYGWTREDFLHIMAVSGGSTQGTLHRLMFTQAGDRAGNSEMEDTWVLQEEEEEEERDEELSPSQTQSLTPALSHKVYKSCGEHTSS